jgi:hypothetical protein
MLHKLFEFNRLDAPRPFLTPSVLTGILSGTPRLLERDSLIQQDPTVPATTERVQTTIDSARAAVERTRELIERAKAAISGAEAALADAGAVTASMNDLRRARTGAPALDEAA